MTGPQVIELVRRIRREAAAGYHIVGVALPQRGRIIVDGEAVPVLGTLDSLPRILQDAKADSVAVTASSSMTGAALRKLGWQLEGTGIDLVVAPALVDVAGPRISIRPVAGLPLLHVEEPEISGFWPLIRTAIYWAALLLVILLSPLLVGIACWIAIDSRGPVLFRQTRAGAGGDPFTVYKFRTMVVDAEERLAELKDRNESDGLLFKMRNDPRVTRAGRFLRKYSLDELPQLFNVLRGDMALVGPRPPLPVGGRGVRGRRTPPADGAPGHHRPLAGQRAFGPVVGGVRTARPLLRGELVAGPGHLDPVEDPVRRPARRRRVLIVHGART